MNLPNTLLGNGEVVLKEDVNNYEVVLEWDSSNIYLIFKLFDTSLTNKSEVSFDDLNSNYEKLYENTVHAVEHKYDIAFDYREMDFEDNSLIIEVIAEHPPSHLTRNYDNL